jgi:hypothetical protein
LQIKQDFGLAECFHIARIQALVLAALACGRQVSSVMEYDESQKRCFLETLGVQKSKTTIELRLALWKMEYSSGQSGSQTSSNRFAGRFLSTAPDLNASKLFGRSW